MTKFKYSHYGQSKPILLATWEFVQCLAIWLIGSVSPVIGILTYNVQ